MSLHVPQQGGENKLVRGMQRALRSDYPADEDGTVPKPFEMGPSPGNQVSGF